MPDTTDKLIIGCGYLGLRVARRWLADGHRVAALTRGRAGEFRSLDIEPIEGDVTNPESLRSLPRAATVLYAVGMDRGAGHSMRDVYVAGLGNVLDALPEPGRFLYVSSTGVYGSADGGEVDETSPTEPTDDSGRTVLAAEQLLRTRLSPAILLRFAGIYGPGRVMRADALRTGAKLAGDPGKWINLIHVDDGVEAVLLAELKAKAGHIYNVADGNPVTRGDFYARAAELLGTAEPVFDPSQSTPRGRGNRRVSNRRIVEELGFSPAHPSYREGLAASLQAE